MKLLEDTEPNVNLFGGIHVEEWLISQKPASILEVMGFLFLFFCFLNNRGRERGRSAGILSLSSFQPMLL